MDEPLAKTVEEIEAKADRMRRASITPLPGPLLDAFDPQQSPTARKYELEIRQPVASDFILFQRLDSPLLKLGQADMALEQEEAAEIIWQLTRPVAVARASFLKGREVFRESAMRDIADKIAPLDMQKLFVEVRDNYISWLSTVVEYDEPPKEGELKVDFSKPLAGTGSAGGSTTPQS